MYLISTKLLNWGSLLFISMSFYVGHLIAIILLLVVVVGKAHFFVCCCCFLLFFSFVFVLLYFSLEVRLMLNSLSNILYIFGHA